MPHRAALCMAALATAALFAACQCPPPVREYRIEKRIDCSPCANPCVSSTHVTQVQRNASMWPVAQCSTGRPYLFTPRAGVCPPPLNPPIPTVCTTATQEYPNGIRHLAGAPLYYETQNLNWEQAPPFGGW